MDTNSPSVQAEKRRQKSQWKSEETDIKDEVAYVLQSSPNRLEKRRKQQKSLGEQMLDPIRLFKIPEVIRKSSSDINKGATEIEAKIRKISQSSEENVNNSPERARAYVDRRQEVLEDAAKLARESRALVRTLRDEGKIDKRLAERAYAEIEESDSAIMKERAYLAANRVKAEFRISSHPSHARIGEAYLVQITSSLEKPAGARINDFTRESTDQSSFKARLKVAYSPPRLPDDDGRPEIPMWCPVRGAFSGWVTAAHIVPAAI
jgi:hypothetical protein